jgi:hypothetical protein
MLFKNWINSYIKGVCEILLRIQLRRQRVLLRSEKISISSFKQLQREGQKFVSSAVEATFLER